MAEQPDQPDERTDAASPEPDQPAPPAKKTPPAKKAAPAKKAVAKKVPGNDPAKKVPAKKAPAKKAAAKKAAPAKKAPAKKAPAKKAPEKVAPPAAEARNDLTTAAKEAAAQAKSAVATASDAVTIPLPTERDGSDSSRVPLTAALVAGVLALVAVLLVARRISED